MNKLALIEWEDPACVGGWLDREDAIADAVAHDRLCQTVGWIVHEDDDLIVLAGSQGCADPPQIGDVFEIPKRVIDRVTYLTPVGG